MRLAMAWPDLQIFAGCFTTKGIQFFRAWQSDEKTAVMNITPFMLDVTDSKSIEKAVGG